MGAGWCSSPSASCKIIDGDPLARLRDSDRVTHVMLNGRLYEAATLNEIGGRGRDRAPYYWED